MLVMKRFLFMLFGFLFFLVFKVRFFFVLIVWSKNGYEFLVRGLVFWSDFEMG